MTLRLGQGIASGGLLAWHRQRPLSFFRGLRGRSAPGHALGAACGKRGSLITEKCAIAYFFDVSSNHVPMSG